MCFFSKCHLLDGPTRPSKELTELVPAISAKSTLRPKLTQSQTSISSPSMVSTPSRRTHGGIILKRATSTGSHTNACSQFKSGARIYTCNWPAELFQKSVPTTLRESADSLRAGISRHLEWNDETRKERPILFIASCLGGIILLKALEIDRSLVKVNSRPSLISATRGIIFLATPFLGTAFKDMPDWELKVWASLNGKEVSALIDYTKNPQALGDLVHTFIGLSKAHEYHVWTFWESCKTNLLSRIYLGWIFSERIYYALPMILVLARALDACFPPWLVALWLLWERCFPAFTPKQVCIMGQISNRLRPVPLLCPCQNSCSLPLACR